MLIAHDGPTPLLHWSFKKQFLKKDQLEAQRGPTMPLPESSTHPTEHGLILSSLTKTPSLLAKAEYLPKESFTITSWFSIHKPTTYGGIVCALEDNGNAEKGWILGYDGSKFYIGVSTEKTDDGDGKITYLRSKANYTKGQIYHLTATYDGKELRLYVNGKLENQTENVGGKILYEKNTHLSVAGYRDRNEDFPHRGQLISVQVYEDVAKEAWIKKEFEHNAEITQLKPTDSSKFEPLASVIEPYLQYGTTDAMTVMWETNHACQGIVHYGETAECKQQVTIPDAQEIHEIRITGLKPGTQYFYKTVSKSAADSTQDITSKVSTFQTDAGPETPYAFAIISDTQGNPRVSGTFAKMAWEHRPNFLLHPGDLVESGGKKEQWISHFFRSMSPLVSRVPFYSVLGNHEHNSANYYNYVSLPDPEYYYKYSYGNAEFFMLDTNKKCDPKSEQYLWLDKALAASTAKWKFVCHHQPAYSSDENDFGNLWKTNKSTRGSMNSRHLAKLYDQHKVDIVWNGHIHSYERTWPIRAGKPVEKDGPIYMITGGGGGPLETPGPFRTPFSVMVQRGHHYAMVWINGGRFEYKAYDINGRLFDTFTLSK
ncbi:hypothetical protein NT6N_21180 [Oceaniferula spumae]|uniref:LamG-like jellyroll fold domain-containing protein n=1 Tax=Oceaniferula spumae TaxID=2979115 RepID=A0AAT9FM99_9BACT